MGLKDCLISAVDQGALSREEAQALADEFDERFAQLRAGMGDAPARAQAKIELEAGLRATAAEARRRANLREAARLNVKRSLQSYRDIGGQPDVFEAAMALLSHYGFRNESSVRGRTEAIVTLAHSKLADLMWDFRRSKLLGTRSRAKVRGRALVKELRGEDSGDETAKAFAKSVAAVFEDLRGRFNAAGGAIPKLEKWGLPQSHELQKILVLAADPAARRAAWKTFIKPLLDPDAMLHPLTGQKVGKAGLDKALDHVFDTIVSGDWAHAVPSMIPAGRGALATQRQDARFLVFRDAASWTAYHEEFGRGDVAQIIFEHINGMARDIAAMEILGPNPQGMVEYLKQVVRLEIGRMQAGQPSLAQRGKLQKVFGPLGGKAGAELDRSLGKFAEHRLDALYMHLRGRPQVISGAADFFDNARNVAGSAVLGSTVGLAGATDAWVAAAARRLAGLPQNGLFMDTLKNLRRLNRRDLVRTGIIWNDYMHVMADDARFFTAAGPEWSRWLTDRTVTLSGLSPLTDARKTAEARAWQAALADEAGKPLAKLDKRMRAALEGFGIDAADWDIMRASVDLNGFVTPAEIARRGGAARWLDLAGELTPEDRALEIRAQAHRRAAEKLAELQSSWGERSVPSTTPNTRSLILGRSERGTFVGEFANLFTQLKGFPLSFTALQIEAIGRHAAAAPDGRAWAGTKYVAAMAIPMTIGAAVYMQIRAMLDGKDPEDMTDPRFWANAMITGGGLGLLGDFARASDTRFGQDFTSALQGPGAAFLSDAAGLTFGNVWETGGWALDQLFGEGEKSWNEQTHAGREAAKFLGRWTPVLSSHWATRGAYRRWIVDQLQKLADPEADASFRAQERNAKSRTGQEFFWPPGKALPTRPPRPLELTVHPRHN